jgi:hypothetical protein
LRRRMRLGEVCSDVTVRVEEGESLPDDVRCRDEVGWRVEGS